MDTESRGEMTISQMDKFFNPTSVAVAGASRSVEKLGNVCIANMQRSGYRGDIFPIHPQGGEIMGLSAYASLRDLPKQVDLAVAVIPRQGVLGLIDQCIEAGIRQVIVTAAGFADDGPQGARLQQELQEVVRASQMRVMGPNSVGTISTESGFVTSLMSLDPIEDGGISIVAQTGLFCGGYGRRFGSSGLPGIAKIASLGNKCDVDELDALEYLAADPKTEVIAFYTEGMGRARDFLELASRLSAEKPIVVLKGGSTRKGGRAASTHTGSMSGTSEIYAGAFRQAGIIQVSCIDDLLGCAKALSYCQAPRGNRVGVVSITGAGCVLAADACQLAGLRMPGLGGETLNRALGGLPDWATFSNPVDLWPAAVMGSVETAYDSVLGAVIQQEDIDMLMVIFTLVPESEFDIADVMVRAMRLSGDKPLLGCILGANDADMRRWSASLERLKIPVYSSIDRTVAAADALASYSRRLEKVHGGTLKGQWPAGGAPLP